MSEAEDAVERVRELFDDLLVEVRLALNAGAPLARMHGHFVARAFDLLEDAEALGLLATTGDREALRGLEDRAAALRELRAELRREVGGG